jgi:hypothetical protein
MCGQFNTLGVEPELIAGVSSATLPIWAVARVTPAPDLPTLIRPLRPPDARAGRAASAGTSSNRGYAMLRQDWKNRCDMASLAQLAGAPRIDGQFRALDHSASKQQRGAPAVAGQ